jgi:hypothetical protein
MSDDVDPWAEAGISPEEAEEILHPAPDREKLPEGAVVCPNCERSNDRDELAWEPDFGGWCCPNPVCSYADPYWNGG